MRVIFLDFDGVLNNGKFLFHNMSNYPDLIMKEKVKLLNTLIERTNANIVFSTSWREQFTFEGLIEILEKVEFKYRDKCVGVTPIAENNKRISEIKEYIDTNNIDEFVILDDCAEELSGFGNDLTKLIIDPNNGLTYEDVCFVIESFEAQKIEKEKNNENKN